MAKVTGDDGLLTAALQPETLHRLAGARSFQRGEAYFEEGAVLSLRRAMRGIQAAVEGTEVYRVRLWIDAGQLDFSCSCPVGQSGAFCKHCVAVGLACLEADVMDGHDPAEELRGYLLSLDKEDLATLLLEQAGGDDALYDRLRLRAAQTKDPPAAKMTWKEAFASAAEIPTGYIEYFETGGIAQGIDKVIDALEDFRETDPEAVIELTEYGLDKLEEDLERVDDSGGWMSGLLERLQKLHLEACERSWPNPVDLAERLFEREMTSNYDVFYRAAVSYAEVLGKSGLDAYRRLAEAEWAALPTREAAKGDWDAESRRLRITAILESLAEADDDFDALVAIRTRDLSSPYNYLQVAELYRDRGQPEPALEWAERGWKAFPPKQQDPGLRSFLATAYTACGRHDDALALVWSAFEADPHLHNYLRLTETADAAGQRAAWRERALELIRRRIAEERTAAAGRRGWYWDAFADHSLLIEIFLHEGDEEAAWEEAGTGGCTTGLWLTLAERRSASHPADAAEVYRRHVVDILRNTGDSVYSNAVTYLEKIQHLHLELDEEEAFHTFLSELRAAHHRKRKFMKMLADYGW